MVNAPSQNPVSAVSVRGLPVRGRVVCHGYIEAVTYAPASQVAAFTAVVVDHEADPAKSRGAGPLPAASATATPAGSRGHRPSVPSDRLRVVWLGRRRIPGIAAGTELRLQGMVTVRDGLPTMFNPRYEIVSRQEDE